KSLSNAQILILPLHPLSLLYHVGSWRYSITRSHHSLFNKVLHVGLCYCVFFISKGKEFLFNFLRREIASSLHIFVCLPYVGDFILKLFRWRIIVRQTCYPDCLNSLH